MMPKIVGEITSRDLKKVLSSSCEIISMMNDSEKIKKFVDYISIIKEQTRNLDFQASAAQSQRTVDFAIAIIEHYRDCKDCICSIYPRLDTINPVKESEKNNIEIIKTIPDEEYWMTTYYVRCFKCHQNFKVIEGEYNHSFWYEWKILEK